MTRAEHSWFYCRLSLSRELLVEFPSNMVMCSLLHLPLRSSLQTEHTCGWRWAPAEGPTAYVGVSVYKVWCGGFSWNLSKTNSRRHHHPCQTTQHPLSWNTLRERNGLANDYDKSWGEVGLEPTAPVFQACVDCGVGPNYLESIPSDIWKPKLLKGKAAFLPWLPCLKVQQIWHLLHIFLPFWHCGSKCP